jgi:hypothetical protein
MIERFSCLFRSVLIAGSGRPRSHPQNTFSSVRVFCANERGLPSGLTVQPPWPLCRKQRTQEAVCPNNLQHRQYDWQADNELAPATGRAPGRLVVQCLPLAYRC